MTERKTPPSLKELGARLRRARGRRKGAEGSEAEGAGTGISGLGMAFRIGVDLVSALIVGVGIGLLIDRWLGTGPWGLVVFFFLGAGAGVLNVYRSAMGYGSAVGYKSHREHKPPGETGPNETGPGGAGSNGTDPGERD